MAKNQKNLSGLRYRYLSQVGLAAFGLMGCGVAQGQEAAASSAAAEDAEASEIVVTGSRIARPGFEAPTPVTSVSAADMETRAPATIADTLATIPSFRPSNTPQTSGVTSRGGGMVTADLRALGPTRSLVLLDGHRFVPSGTDGVVDLKLIPQLMIGSVEVVTGGASAAYGSDAVAGVVNFKLDKNIKGVRASIQGGISQHGDGESIRASFAAGQSFAEGRINVSIGGDYSKLYGIGNQYSRDWGRREFGLLTNPAFGVNGQPNFIIAENVHPSSMTPGGLVTSGPLAGTMFLPNGGVGTFTYGTVYGTSMIGGDNEGNHLSRATLLSSPVESYVGMAHIDAELSDAIRPYVELSYGDTRTKSQSQEPRLQGGLAIPVSINNAYLPQSVRDAMAANGLTTITVSRLMNDTGPIKLDIFNRTLRLLGGVQGDIGGGWSYDAYFQYGRNKSGVSAGPNNLIFGRFLQEVAGCPTPAMVAAGCQPINIFGDGSVQVDNYAFGTAQFRLTTEQRVASFNVNGNPFSTWAGEVSIATGIEYRKEEAIGTSDPISQLPVPIGTSGQTIAGGFTLGNQVPFAGSYDLWEAYGEVLVPLLRDAPFARAVDFNGAVRRTDYSSSGVVTTWKLGLTWQVTDEFKLRGTRSKDIRAPNLEDLFTSGGSRFAIVFDPAISQTVLIRTVLIGNPALRPENAKTWTAGMVYEPDWLPGAGFSVDYYNITVNGIIGTLPAGLVVSQCTAGNTTACNSIVRNANGSIAFLNQVNENLDALKTSGLDIEARYQTSLPLFGDDSGKLSLRMLATYVDKLNTISSTGGVLKRAGTVSSNAGSTATSTGLPHLTGVFDINYSTDKWLVNLQTRFVGKGKFNVAYTTGSGAANTINDNDVPAYAYLSLAAQYNLNVGGQQVQLFGTINNLLNTDPPMIPSGQVAFANETSTNPAFYDVIGRNFTLGARVRF